jgi:hypothetical protein
MSEKKEIDYNNFDNVIKRLFPEFNSFAQMSGMGPLPNFVQKQMSESISKGVTPDGEITPMRKHFIMKELNNA